MFTALTFNMQNGQIWDEADPRSETIDLQQTVDFLLGQNADVILLQEVERGYEGGAQYEPPPNYHFLKDRLVGYHGLFGYPRPNPLQIPFGLGQAIFSKTPLHNLLRVELPPPEITFEYAGIERKPSYRLLLGAQTEIDGRTLTLLNTHLQAFFMIKSSSNVHRSQRDLVEEELRKLDGAVLLAGDFNCNPEETLVGQFAGAGFQTAQNSEITWKRMPFVLDHLFFNTPLKLESVEVIPTSASDHHAVKGTFSFA